MTDPDAIVTITPIHNTNRGTLMKNALRTGLKVTTATFVGLLALIFTITTPYPRGDGAPFKYDGADMLSRVNDARFVAATKSAGKLHVSASIEYRQKSSLWSYVGVAPTWACKGGNSRSVFVKPASACIFPDQTDMPVRAVVTMKSERGDLLYSATMDGDAKAFGYDGQMDTLTTILDGPEGKIVLKNKHEYDNDGLKQRITDIAFHVTTSNGASITHGNIDALSQPDDTPEVTF